MQLPSQSTGSSRNDCIVLFVGLSRYFSILNRTAKLFPLELFD